MANVVLRGVTKTYPAAGNRPAFTAVRGIDLEVRDGEFMVLVGPSGCGKSTTLRMIAGLDEASGGTITIGDRVVNDLRPNERDIAMVFQSYALYPHMSVYDNMAFGLTLRKLPRAEIDQRVKEAANLLGLAEVLDRKPKTLSGGQRQRVAVGRAIVRQPKVFLFDEPLSNLDAKMRVSMRAELSRLHDRLGATMIYVTHDQVEAMTLGDRICIMNEGAIVQTDTPLNLYQRPAALFAAGFIGSPAMNFFSGRIEGPPTAPVFVEDNDAPDAVRLALPPRLASAASARAGAPVILGVRPEDVGPERTATPRCEARARLEVAELMGAETFLHLSTGKTTFVARAPNRAYAPGDLIPVTFDLERAHLFDPTTTASLV